MAKYRKLGRTSSQRKALLRNQVTNLLYHGKIVTTESKAKEVRKIAEGLIAMAVREKDNYETVTVMAKVAKRDADGKREKKVVDGKKVALFEEVAKEIKKDSPSRLHARRQMLKVFYPVKEVPTKNAGKKRNTKQVDMVDKMFSEIAPKYEGRNGGYTRIVKIGPRKGDAAMEVVLELVQIKGSNGGRGGKLRSFWHISNLHAPGSGRTTTHESLAGAFGIPELMPAIRRREF